MVSTRKLDLDSLLNVFIAVALIVYSGHRLHLHPGAGNILSFAAFEICGMLVQYGALLMTVSATFWIIGSQGLEGSYFTLFEFSRLPREAFKGLANVVFVWTLPVVIVSNVPARTLIHGLELSYVPWVAAVTIGWVGLGAWIFHRGLRRYSSASS